MRTRSERRELTKRKLKHREIMMKDLGTQGGLLYERHIEKVNKSSGYMRDGNVSHYVRCGFTIKTKNSAKHRTYGKGHIWSRHDKRQIDKVLESQIEDYNDWWFIF